MKQTKRIRLNQEYRNKIAKRIEVGLDQENTIEKEKYLQLREQIKPLQDKTWNLMSSLSNFVELLQQLAIDRGVIGGGCMYVCEHVCMYVCVYAFICIFIGTYIYIYIYIY